MIPETGKRFRYSMVSSISPSDSPGRPRIVCTTVFQTAVMQPENRILEAAQRIASADITGRPLVNSLQPKLYPDRLPAVQRSQKLQYVVPQTVRAGGAIDTASTSGCRMASENTVSR